MLAPRIVWISCCLYSSASAVSEAPIPLSIINTSSSSITAASSKSAPPVPMPKPPRAKAVAPSIKGTEYEEKVVSILSTWQFILSRTGKAGDGGVDFRGTWTPKPEESIPIIGQCRCNKTKLGPKHVRELEGTIAHQNGQGLLGLLVSPIGFSAAAIEQFRGSAFPMILSTISPSSQLESEMAETAGVTVISERETREMEKTNEMISHAFRSDLAKVESPALFYPREPENVLALALALQPDMQANLQKNPYISKFSPFAKNLSKRIEIKNGVKVITHTGKGYWNEALTFRKKSNPADPSTQKQIDQKKILLKNVEKKTVDAPEKAHHHHHGNDHPRQYHQHRLRHLSKTNLWPIRGFLVNDAALKFWPKIHIGSRKLMGQFSNQGGEGDDVPVAFYDGHLVFK